MQFPNTNPTHFGTYGSLGIPPTLMSPTSNTSDQYSVTKPRMRICFDPETEIPKLQKWFAENNHPTRQQVKSSRTEGLRLKSRASSPFDRYKYSRGYFQLFSKTIGLLDSVSKLLDGLVPFRSVGL